MPIPADEFLQDSVKRKLKHRGANQRKILEFLREHHDEAYTQTEIQDELDIEYAPSVNATLHSLKLRGLTSCKMLQGKNYWRATPWQEEE